MKKLHKNTDTILTILNDMLQHGAYREMLPDIALRLDCIHWEQFDKFVLNLCHEMDVCILLSKYDYVKPRNKHGKK
jgi:hypothetical protein